MRPLTPLAQIFANADKRDKQRRNLAGGQILLSPGDAAATIYRVVNGLFAVIDPIGRLAGLIGPGEMIGEMAIFARDDHRNQVIALRDSVVETLPAERFLERAVLEPALMIEVARTMAIRQRAPRDVPPPVRTVLVSAISPGVEIERFCTRLASECTGLGISTCVAARPLTQDLGWLGRLEQNHDFVLIPARLDEADWAALCRRQVDRVLLVAHPDDAPSEDCAVCSSEPIQAYQRVDLAIDHGKARIAGAGSFWTSATQAARIFHTHRDGTGVKRLARILTGRSNGLVLSGGGARAFAHIGVIASLGEAGIPIDLVGGTSMGAIIAAGHAAGWSALEMDLRMRRAFVASNPLDDATLPILALTRGGKVDARLFEHFGAVAIEDLQLPFFCVSTDLTAGRHRVHNRGRVDRALRASISLPGILPPIVEGDSVLVDGGVLRNLPTDVMRRLHEGQVIGSDVGREQGLEPHHLNPPMSWLRWFASGQWRGGPPIVSVLMRSATVSSAIEIERARRAADVYIMPQLDNIEIRDWHAYDRAVEAGRAAAEGVLQRTSASSELRFAEGTS